MIHNVIFTLKINEIKTIYRIHISGLIRLIESNSTGKERARGKSNRITIVFDSTDTKTLSKPDNVYILNLEYLNNEVDEK